jgi:hypothetical protein
MRTMKHKIHRKKKGGNLNENRLLNNIDSNNNLQENNLVNNLPNNMNSNNNLRNNDVILPDIELRNNEEEEGILSTVTSGLTNTTGALTNMVSGISGMFGLGNNQAGGNFGEASYMTPPQSPRRNLTLPPLIRRNNNTSFSPNDPRDLNIVEDPMSNSLHDNLESTPGRPTNPMSGGKKYKRKTVKHNKSKKSVKHHKSKKVAKHHKSKKSVKHHNTKKIAKHNKSKKIQKKHNKLTKKHRK